MVTAAEAEVKAAEANVDVRKTEISQTAAIRRFREKEYIRYMESPATRPSTSGSPMRRKNEDEGAKAAEEKAHASVKAAEAELRVPGPRSSLPRPIWKMHLPRNGSPRPAWARRRSWPSTSHSFPLYGWVTRRNFHDGDFIREATGVTKCRSCRSLEPT